VKFIASSRNKFCIEVPTTTEMLKVRDSQVLITQKKIDSC